MQRPRNTSQMASTILAVALLSAAMLLASGTSRDPISSSSFATKTTTEDAREKVATFAEHPQETSLRNKTHSSDGSSPTVAWVPLAPPVLVATSACCHPPPKKTTISPPPCLVRAVGFLDERRFFGVPDAAHLGDAFDLGTCCRLQVVASNNESAISIDDEQHFSSGSDTAPSHNSSTALPISGEVQHEERGGCPKDVPYSFPWLRFSNSSSLVVHFPGFTRPYVIIFVAGIFALEIARRTAVWLLNFWHPFVAPRAACFGCGRKRFYYRLPCGHLFCSSCVPLTVEHSQCSYCHRVFEPKELRAWVMEADVAGNTTPFTPDYPPLESSRDQVRPSLRCRRCLLEDNAVCPNQVGTDCLYKFNCLGANADFLNIPCQHRTICRRCLREFVPHCCILCGLWVDEMMQDD